ncbi:MAG: hypothetical protein ABI718_04315 [Acidobacteriota bacterium]
MTRLPGRVILKRRAKDLFYLPGCPKAQPNFTRFGRGSPDDANHDHPRNLDTPLPSQ